jgi:hypothetical protein
MKKKLVLQAAALLAPVAAFAADGPSAHFGKWRITRAVVAPWTDEAGAGEAPALVGETVVFKARSVKAPAPLGCANAKYETTSVPPEGLFQGAELTVEQASNLGLVAGDLTGMSLACDTGVFEFHDAGPQAMLFALDNRIWTLDRSPGALASASSPEGAVQRFLEAHFAGDMGFSAEALASKRDRLSPALAAAIDAYFARPQDPEEAPPIDGDPFTDSQDYPARFSVKLDDRKTKGTAVPVVFADAFRERTVVFEMTREKGRWLIDDLKFEDGSTLSTWLAEEPTHQC